MKIEILNEKDNPLLKRREFAVKVTHDAATPSISEIKKKITSKEVGKGTIVLDSFISKYGCRETLGTVKVYQTKERALEIEPKYRLKKNGLLDTEGKPSEAKPKEEKEEAKPPKKAETEAEKKPEKKEEKPMKKEGTPKEDKSDKKKGE